MDIDNWEDLPLLHAQHPSTDARWVEAIRRYLGAINDRPLRRCLEVVREAGARTVVIETGYIDLDYRSEYGSYFAHQFRHRPDTAHRLHFFADRLDVDEIERGAGSASYLGYVVLRPCETGPVSRAVLQPPPSIADAVRTAVSDTVNLCGQELVVTGVPFSQQDAQLGSCAHASAWMCHYAAALRGDAPRRSTGHIAAGVDSALSSPRPIPTRGLTALQLSELFRHLELPAHYYEVGSLPSPGLQWQRPDPQPPPGSTQAAPGTWDDRIVPVVCRFLNSGLPVLVGTHDHAFVLCGYRRTMRNGARWVEFIRHDDQRGPYLQVDDVLSDVDPTSRHNYGPWSTIHIPAPEKLWLAPEQAERGGGLSLHKMTTRLSNTITGTPQKRLHAVLTGRRLSLRTYAVKSNRFKMDLQSRLIPWDIAAAYRHMSLPRYVWVVEAVDRQLRNTAQQCVLGEALYDATSSDYAPEILAIHVAGTMLIAENVRSMSVSPVTAQTQAPPYESGGVGPA